MRNRLAAALTAVWLAGCAGGRKAAQPLPAAADDSVASQRLVAQRRDSANTLEAHWRSLDSVQAPAEFASKLYLLTLDNFLKVAPDDPRASQVRLWKANQLYNSQDYAAAVREYQEILKRYPNSPVTAEADQMIAQSYERQGEHVRAEDWYRRMLKDTSESVRRQAEERIAQSIYLQAGDSEKAGDFPAAARVYARVSQEFPHADIAPIALFNAGVMAERTQNWKGAIAFYNRFFDLYYDSDVLPRAMFREAKCRELNGEFKAAGEKYVNLAKTYPRSPQAEAAAYSAGFAFASAGLTAAAAHAFENYATLYPDQAEAPNLLSRAVEAYGALKDWDKVAELEREFAQRYGGDKSRLVQALSMGGLTAGQRGQKDQARGLSQKALAEFAQLSSPDATARYYAAQAHQTLGDLEAARMRDLPLRPSALESDLNAKRAALRAAVEEYLAAMELKIVDGVIQAGTGMGEAFRTYGDEAYAALRRPGAVPADRAAAEAAALSERASAYSRAADQYLRVLTVAREQKVNNRAIQTARTALRRLMGRTLAGLNDLDSALAAAYPFRQGTVEEALSLRLARAQKTYQAYQENLEWIAGDFPPARVEAWDSATADTVGGEILGRVLAQGRMFQAVVDTAEAAPIPAGYDSVQTFFYLAKLQQDLLPSVAARAADVFTAGLRFADSAGLAGQPATRVLRAALGRSLFATAHAFDMLADRALSHPPIPAGLPDAQRKTFQKKFEQIGYALRDKGVEAHRALVSSAVQGLASPAWAARSFAALMRVEPDRWTSPGRDTVQTFQTGAGWKVCLKFTVASDCPDSAWGPVVPAAKGDSTASKRNPGIWIRAPEGPKNAASAPIPMVFAAPLPWSEDPDSVQMECAATAPVHFRLGGDSLPPYAAPTTAERQFTLSPRAGNLPPIEFKQGVLLALTMKARPDTAAVLFRMRVFGRVGAGEIVFPWNHQRVSQAALDSLQSLPFPAPNFEPVDAEKH